MDDARWPPHHRVGPHSRLGRSRLVSAHAVQRARLYTTWAWALIRHRTARLAATAIGIALAVGLLASLGTFLSASKATMTARAIETVAVDWQIEAQPGADAASVSATSAADPRVVDTEPVAFATTSGFESSHGGTTQTTGPGQVVGITDSYRSTFPAELRELAGATHGALLFQQTAANLAAQPGDTISIGRAGLPPAMVTIDGIVDVP